METQLKEISIEKIAVEKNHRETDREHNLAELMAHISAVGLINPITVREVKSGKYEVVAGHRRLQAMKKLGWINAKCHVMALSPYERDIVNHGENFHRKDPTVWEEGMIYAEDYTARNMGFAEIASKYKISKDRVKKCIEIFNDIPEEFKADIVFADRRKQPGKIGIRNAQAIISRVKRANLPKASLSKILTVARKNDLTSRQIDVMSQLIKRGKSVESAISKMDTIQVLIMTLTVRKSALEKIEATGTPYLQYVQNLLKKHKELGIIRGGRFHKLSKRKEETVTA